MPSNTTSLTFRPTMGWWDGPPAQAPPGSVTSGANWWVRDGRLEKRSALTLLGSNATFPFAGGMQGPMGTSEYVGSHGTRFPVVFVNTSMFNSRFAYFNGTSWVTTTSFAGGTGTATSNVTARGASVHLPRSDTNAFIIATAGAVFLWPGVDSGSTAVSAVTNSPVGAQDIVACDRRVLVWNVLPSSGVSRVEQRVAWCVFNNPEDWTGPGSGFYDLTDIKGAGTRCFNWNERVVLATSEEIWMAVPDARRAFAFTPITREQGIPFAGAAIQTPDGIFWLGRDFMIYRWAGQAVEPIGGPIQRTLRDALTNAVNVSLGYFGNARQLTVHYGTAGRAFAYNFESQRWMPQQYAVSSGTAPYTFIDNLSNPNGMSLGLWHSDGTLSTHTFGTTYAAADFNSARTASLDFTGLLANSQRLHIVDDVRLVVNVTTASALTAALFSDISVAGGPLSASSNLSLAVVVSGESVVRWNPAYIPARRFTLRLDERTTGQLAISEVALTARDVGAAL